MGLKKTLESKPFGYLKEWRVLGFCNLRGKEPIAIKHISDGAWKTKHIYIRGWVN